MSDDLKQIAVEALEDIKGIDIVVLDVSELTTVADAMIVATGATARQVKALADNVIEKARERGYRPIGVEGQDGAEWILIDFGSLLVHVMQPQSREFYDLERLWGARPGSQSKPNRVTDGGDTFSTSD